MFYVAIIAAVMAGIGLIQCIAGAVAVTRFRSRTGPVSDHYPPVTVLKPLHGTEPLLEDALASVCRQEYPTFQIVFGVQDEADPAIAVVRRLQSRFPARDLELVIDSTRHGSNLKVGNLINMARAARYDIFVIADSDLVCAPDYLTRIVGALSVPQTGLVTTLYAGLPAELGLTGWMGAMHITLAFLPGALVARCLGRQDCLGATMALRRETLATIGGLSALSNHLADDNVLGRLVAAHGLMVGLAHTAPLTIVSETTIGALFRHELRWARTIRALVPTAFAASILQYPIAWALLALLFTLGAAWTFAVLFLALAIRGLAAIAIYRTLARMLPTDRQSALATSAPIWLLPIRELMSVVVMAASYAGYEVTWRGHRTRADRPAR